MVNFGQFGQKWLKPTKARPKTDSELTLSSGFCYWMNHLFFWDLRGPCRNVLRVCFIAKLLAICTLKLRCLKPEKAWKDLRTVTAQSLAICTCDPRFQDGHRYQSVQKVSGSEKEEIPLGMKCYLPNFASRRIALGNCRCFSVHATVIRGEWVLNCLTKVTFSKLFAN